MINTMEQMEADSTSDQNEFGLPSGKITSDDSRLESLGELSRELVNKRAALAFLEDDVKFLKRQVQRIEEVDLPEAMAEIGIAKFTLDDGTSIMVKDEIGAHIKVADRYKAHEWLRNNGFADIVKNDYTITFGKGENDKAAALQQLLDSDSRFSNWKNKEAVHPCTLKAVIREQLEGGNAEFMSTEVMELLGIRQFKKATIK